MESKKPESVRLGSRYLLHDLLGRGGMGAVYLATDRLTGSTVALKHVTSAPADLMFGSRGTDSSDLSVALAQEFRTLASMRHPNVVSVLDYGFDDQRQPYFTMEFVPDAHTIVEAAKGKSTVEKLDLLAQVLQALVYLHRRNILHRDLKPGNVLVTGDGKVKVLDFGLSLVSHQTVADLTQTVAGTIAYMAPELASPGGISPAIDIYALGITLFEMLTGKVPFTAPHQIGVLIAHVQQPIPSIIGHRPDLPDELQKVFNRVLAKDPSDRYVKAKYFAEAL